MADLGGAERAIHLSRVDDGERTDRKRGSLDGPLTAELPNGAAGGPAKDGAKPLRSGAGPWIAVATARGVVLVHQVVGDGCSDGRVVRARWRED